MVKPDVKITKINEVYLKLEAEPYILQEISDKFTFDIPGAKFSPLYRAKKWDGKIRIFDKRGSKLYYGNLLEALEFLSSKKYTVEISNEIEGHKSFSLLEAKKFTDSLKLPFQVNDHQMEAFVHCIRQSRKLILSPTGSGKSLLLYLMITYLALTKKKGLIVVPTVNLVEQMTKDFQFYSKNNGINIDSLVHKVYQGVLPLNNKYLTISTWQSLQKEDISFFDKYDFVLCDECHLAQAKSITGILTKMVNASFRIGVTGSLSGSKTHQSIIEGLTGPVEKVTSTTKLIEKGILSEFRIKCLVLKHSESKRKLMKDSSYQDEISYLIGSEERNQFIVNLSFSLYGNTLVLFQQVENHGKILYELLKLQDPSRKIYYISGETDVIEREKIREILETETNAILVASYGTVSTGVNIKNLHNLIFGSPSKSRIRVLQSIGRILRLSEDGRPATLFDISDDLRIGSFQNFTLNHFGERLKIYSEEHFPYKMYKIDL